MGFVRWWVCNVISKRPKMNTYIGLTTQCLTGNFIQNASGFLFPLLEEQQMGVFFLYKQCNCILASRICKMQKKFKELQFYRGNKSWNYCGVNYFYVDLTWNKSKFSWNTSINYDVNTYFRNTGYLIAL